jgi:hypothetical protein
MRYHYFFQKVFICFLFNDGDKPLLVCFLVYLTSPLTTKAMGDEFQPLLQVPWNLYFPSLVTISCDNFTGLNETATPFPARDKQVN